MDHIFVVIVLSFSTFTIISAQTNQNPFEESKCGDAFSKVCKDSKYRTYDGSCNNKYYPTWGMTFTRYARLIPANYADGFYSPRVSESGKALPLGRILSRVLNPDKRIMDKKFTSLATEWTQIITHDILLTDAREDTPDTNCCSKEGKLIRDPAKHPLCYPAFLPENDPDFECSKIECFNSFLRKHTDIDRGCAPRNGVANQLAITTHFSDLSGVYGVTEKDAINLREFKGGRLLTETRKNRQWPPKDNTCLKEAKVCYKTGEENSYSYGLIYNTTGYVNDYDPSVDPSTLNEGAAAIFRAFHTLLSGESDLVNENRDPPYDVANLNDLFNNPSIVEKDDNYNSLVRGLATRPQEAYDQYYHEEMTVFVNLGPQFVRADARALDIQRGRDHGLGTYNQYREFCGFPKAECWDDFSDFISFKNIEDLRKIYESPDDVDMTVGATLERGEPGSLLGPTFLCILNEEMYRTRVGDRFFYENGKSGYPFTLCQLNEIRKATVSRLLCDNSEIKTIQRYGFEKISEENPLVSCKSLPKMDLSLWKE